MSQQFLKTTSGRTLVLPSAQEDAAIDAAIAAGPDTREWLAADFAEAQPAKVFFDPATYAQLTRLKRKPGERGPQQAPTKVATTIRLSPEVMAAFKATGAGWQTRIDAALKDWLKNHSPV